MNMKNTGTIRFFQSICRLGKRVRAKSTTAAVQNIICIMLCVIAPALILLSIDISSSLSFLDNDTLSCKTKDIIKNIEVSVEGIAPENISEIPASIQVIPFNVFKYLT